MSRGGLYRWKSFENSNFVLIFASKTVSVYAVTSTEGLDLVGQVLETGWCERRSVYSMQAICVSTPLNSSLMFRQKRGNGVNTAAQRVGLR